MGYGLFIKQNSSNSLVIIIQSLVTICSSSPLPHLTHASYSTIVPHHRNHCRHLKPTTQHLLLLKFTVTSITPPLLSSPSPPLPTLAYHLPALQIHTYMHNQMHKQRCTTQIVDCSAKLTINTPLSSSIGPIHKDLHLQLSLYHKPPHSSFPPSLKAGRGLVRSDFEGNQTESNTNENLRN